MTFDPNFGKTGFPLKLFQIRFRRLKINQADFAKRFGLSFGMVRDVEQGRVNPSRALRVLVELIDENPSMVAVAAERANAEPR
jgi:DNA-binding transcriptional regulator YiaG